jgi:hypothetical protein
MALSSCRRSQPWVHRRANIFLSGLKAFRLRGAQKPPIKALLIMSPISNELASIFYVRTPAGTIRTKERVLHSEWQHVFIDAAGPKLLIDGEPREAMKVAEPAEIIDPDVCVRRRNARSALEHSNFEASMRACHTPRPRRPSDPRTIDNSRPPPLPSVP